MRLYVAFIYSVDSWCLDPRSRPCPSVSLPPVSSITPQIHTGQYVPGMYLLVYSRTLTTSVIIIQAISHNSTRKSRSHRSIRTLWFKVATRLLRVHVYERGCDHRGVMIRTYYYLLLILVIQSSVVRVRVALPVSYDRST